MSKQDDTKAWTNCSVACGLRYLQILPRFLSWNDADLITDEIWGTRVIVLSIKTPRLRTCVLSVCFLNSNWKCIYWCTFNYYLKWPYCLIIFVCNFFLIICCKNAYIIQWTLVNLSIYVHLMTSQWHHQVLGEILFLLKIPCFWKNWTTHHINTLKAA